MAASKIIHFTVGERSERAEFMNDAKVEDLKGNLYLFPISSLVFFLPYYLCNLSTDDSNVW